MYQAVIFDLDGTLLNTLTDLANAANAALAGLGYPQHPVEAYKMMVGNGIPKLIERFLPPEHRDAETREKAAALFFPYYSAHKADTTAPYPGIPELLASLRAKGVRLGVVSNKEDALTKAVIAHYFPGAFDAVCGHVPGTPTKPEPHLVNTMRAAFGTAESETLYAGDSNVDIATAHNARLAGCGVTWGFRTESELRQAGADFIVHTPEALGALVLGQASVKARKAFRGASEEMA